MNYQKIIKYKKKISTEIIVLSINYSNIYWQNITLLL